MTVAEKENTIEINDTDDQQVDNDEATIIVNQTLAEIKKEQVLTQEQDRSKYRSSLLLQNSRGKR